MNILIVPQLNNIKYFFNKMATDQTVIEIRLAFNGHRNLFCFPVAPPLPNSSTCKKL